ncbi:hypothetical protein FRC03_005138 [Tulasnella sp. 419]|nr:hypothetical protein FRC03_005138 [Tulasnella sp. 419]
MSDDAALWAAMGMPMSFGKQTKKKAVSTNFDKMKRADAGAAGPSTEPPVEEMAVHALETRTKGPSKPHNFAPSQNDDEPDVGPPPPRQGDYESRSGSSDDDDDEDDDEEDGPSSKDMFPISHEVVLKDHTKVVSALTLDPSGARVLSGSHDYDCKLWDFGGMGAGNGVEPKPFRTWEPAETYYVHDVKYSPHGDRFLVISGTTQAKLFDKDGEELATFMKGDMYLRDMKLTSGHVGELTGCAWHPKEENTFITSSNDSTIRIWDTEDKRKQKTVIVVKSKERGARTKVTSCAFSPDGKIIVGACLDGTLNLWSTSSNFVRPSQTAENAHQKNTETGSVAFSLDNKTILTRGNDEYTKLWDIRAFRKPIYTSPKLTTLYPETNAAFSPDEKFIVTGTAANRTEGGRGRGTLTFLHREGLEIERQVQFDEGESVVKVFWHSRINQIACGTSTGAIRVLYSPQTSLNGAKLLLNKSKKKATIESYAASLLQAPIITPHALPMFRDDGERGTKRKRDKDRNDPRKTRKPMPPVTGPGKGGRVGASATQHVVQALVRDSTRDEDPREALLKYAAVSEKDPKFTAAWKATQPKPVFQQDFNDEEEEEK